MRLNNLLLQDIKITVDRGGMKKLLKKRRDRIAYMKEYRTGQLYKDQRDSWLNKHPDYYKEWNRKNPNYYKKYREKNRGILRLYQKRWRGMNRMHRRNYIRKYMNEYRSRMKYK